MNQKPPSKTEKATRREFFKVVFSTTAYAATANLGTIAAVRISQKRDIKKIKNNADQPLTEGELNRLIINKYGGIHTYNASEEDIAAKARAVHDSAAKLMLKVTGMTTLFSLVGLGTSLYHARENARLEKQASTLNPPDAKTADQSKGSKQTPPPAPQ